MNSHSTQLELSKHKRSLLHLPAQLTIFLQTPSKCPTAFWAHYCLHRKWQSSYSCDPRCVHCIFWFVLWKIPVLDSWQPSPDCILADRAKCPGWSFILYIEKNFGFLIDIFLLLQGSIFGLGALLWHSVPSGQPWDKYWITVYMANKVNVSADDNWKKTKNQHPNVLNFTGKHAETSSRTYSAKNKGWDAFKTPQMTTFVPVPVLGPERAEQPSLPASPVKQVHVCSVSQKLSEENAQTTPKDHLTNE